MARLGRGQPSAPIVHRTLYDELLVPPAPVTSQLFGAVGMPTYCVWLAWLLVFLWVTVLSAATVSLAWEAPTLNTNETPLTDLASYNLYRCAGSACTPVLLLNVGLVTIYQDTTVSLGTFYRYLITAVDTTGNESPASNIIAIGPPPAPINVLVE